MRISSKNAVTINAIDLFCGAGGLSTGLEKSGIKILGAVEIDYNAALTYKANHPKTVVFEQDIQTLSGADILSKLQVGELDLVVGCPPCQGFSSLTFKNKKEDERNLLVLEFLRIVREIKPKAVMLENVPGLTGHGNKLFSILYNGLSDMGYLIDYRILQVADYGVPQKRRRLVLLAGHGFKMQIPNPTNSEKGDNGLPSWKTLYDAIGKFSSPTFVSEIKGRSYASLNWHVARDMKEINKRRLACLKEGDPRYGIPEALRPNCHKGDKKGFGNVYGRMKWDEPSVTITRGCTTISMGRFGHPSENRALSVREAATIQTFPLNYKFQVNSIEKACVLIGNAFPCKLAKKLGDTIVATLQSHL